VGLETGLQDCLHCIKSPEGDRAGTRSMLARHSFPTERFSFLFKEKEQIENSQEVLIETNKSV
jgi:hypothetical protein